jgi:hypothetical protein
LQVNQYTTIPAMRKWSEVRTYDERTGQLASVTDARGIRRLLDYGTDPLGRIQSVSYADLRVLAVAAGTLPQRRMAVVPVGPTTYQYVRSGDLSLPTHISAAGAVTKSFNYDLLGRVKSVVTSIDASLLPGAAALGPVTPVANASGPVEVVIPQDRALSLATLYGYDDVGRLNTVGESEVPPFSARGELIRALNTASNSVTFGFGVGGRIVSSNIRLANSSAAWKLSGIVYNSSGQMVTRRFAKDVPLGNSLGLTETFDYDSKNLLERRHSVTPLLIGPRPSTGPKLFDTSYSYTRSERHVQGAGSHVGVGFVQLMPPVGQLFQQNDATIALRHRRQV